MKIRLNTVLIGLAGGGAAALLFLAVLGGGLMAAPLFLLSPLSIAIVGLSWGSRAGAIAAFAGAALVAVLTSPEGGLVFLLLIAGPMAWYAHAAGLARPVPISNAPEGLEWYPIGRILLTMAIVTPLTIIAVGAMAGFNSEEFATILTSAQMRFFETIAAPGAQLPDRETVLEQARLLIRLMPFSTAMTWLLLVAFNLWLGGRIARISGYLTRPWVKLPKSIQLPSILAMMWAVAMVAALHDSALGLIAGAFAGSFSMAFALQGLAVIHARTMGMSSRPFILAAIYGGILIIALPLIPITLLGVADSFIGLRKSDPTRRLPDETDEHFDQK